MKNLFLVFAAFISINAFCWPDSNTLPPMGWEPWNVDHCGNNSKWDAEYYKKLADIFVSSGLRDLGYVYLTIECDDHYRDTVTGKWIPNPVKFPDGYKPVIDYIHSKGLKVRAYTDAGHGKCCCFNYGSYGYYESDAKTWIENGFDGVKIDWCGGSNEKLDPKTQFLEIVAAVKKYSNSFSIEICTWGVGNPWEWGYLAGNIWRTSGDIDYCGPNGFPIGGCWFALTRNVDANRHPDKNLCGPGKGWNYADMLLVGTTGGLNDIEERTQFTMWSIMASPLFLGNDVFNMTKVTKETLFNKEVIAVDQDPLGVQGDVVKEYNKGLTQVWKKDMADGSKAVALFNKDSIPQEITVNWSDIGITGNNKIRDLWEHADKGVSTDQYTATVPAHGTAMLRISKK